MEEIIKIIKNSPAIYLATVDNENKPNNRPVALALEEKGVLYFGTSSETSIYNDLKSNAFVAITVMTADYVWIRISAKCVFTEDIALKEKILLEKEFLKNTFQTAENAKYKLFFLESGTATMCDYSGNPPKKYTF